VELLRCLLLDLAKEPCDHFPRIPFVIWNPVAKSEVTRDCLSGCSYLDYCSYSFSLITIAGEATPREAFVAAKSRQRHITRFGDGDSKTLHQFSTLSSCEALAG
jgi:hypothetical protein